MLVPKSLPNEPEPIEAAALILSSGLALREDGRLFGLDEGLLREDRGGLAVGTWACADEGDEEAELDEEADRFCSFSGVSTFIALPIPSNWMPFDCRSESGVDASNADERF